VTHNFVKSFLLIQKWNKVSIVSEGFIVNMSNKHTHTHTHKILYIYIYIYMYMWDNFSLGGTNHKKIHYLNLKDVLVVEKVG